MKTKICRKAGCSRTCEQGKTYCIQHSELENKIFTKRGKSSEYNNWYRTSRWRQLRASFLRSYPTCFICGNKATIADHIIPHKGNINLFYDANNLQPMCWSCHSRKTFAENKNFNKPSPQG